MTLLMLNSWFIPPPHSNWLIKIRRVVIGQRILTKMKLENAIRSKMKVIAIDNIQGWTTKSFHAFQFENFSFNRLIFKSIKKRKKQRNKGRGQDGKREEIVFFLIIIDFILQHQCFWKSTFINYHKTVLLYFPIHLYGSKVDREVPRSNPTVTRN